MPLSKVFISYSHKDRAWLERLQVHLKPLERDGLIERWDDTRIGTGDRWRDEIKRAIISAQVVILLISADFLASDFIEKEELPPLLDLAEKQGAAILPVIIGYCLLDGPNSKLAQYQAVNSPSEPLESLNEPERNRVWVDLARDVLARLERVPAPPPAPAVVELPHAPPSSAPPTGAATTPAATTPAVPVSVPGQGRYALLVINDKHADPIYAGTVAPLDETLGLEGVLTSEEVGGFEVRTLRNEACDAVQKAIDGFFAVRQPDDIALLYYYGIAVKDAESGLEFITTDSERDDPSSSIQVFEVQKAMRRSKSLRQLVIFDCVFLGAYTKELPLALCDRRSFLARFQGEGRFVLSAPEALRLSWERGTTPRLPEGGPGACGTLIAAMVHGLKTGKADIDRNRRVDIGELFSYVEEAVSGGDPTKAPVRWAFDQSKADLVIANASLPGEDRAPTPIVRRYLISQDIRQPILDLTVPTYILDQNFFLLDWNPAFDEIIAKPLKLARGQDHATSFIQALGNVEEVVRHAKQVFGSERHPLVDTEILVFKSEKYGEVRFRKVAAQITDDEGHTKGWSVGLNVLDAGGGDGIWPDVLARIEEEVSWSRYAVVYDALLLKFPAYRKLIEQVTSLLDGKRRCIDLGAGTGNNALRLLEDPNREVWAVEINETMLRHFRAKLANDYPPEYADRLTIVKDNILRLDALPRASFDAAVMTNVLYAVRDPECCLRQVNRILKPGGILALSNPHRETDVDSLFDQLQHSLDKQDLFDQYQDHFDAARARHDAMLDLIHRDSIDDIRRMLDEAGFQVEGEPVPAYVGAVVVIKAVEVRDPIVRATASTPTPADVVSALAGQAIKAPAPATPKQGEFRDVFLSYSTPDQEIADQIQAYLEHQAISCWVSSRDIQSSQDFAAAIVHAINRSRLMVLILSPSANKSEHTRREVALAAKQGIPIIPFRAENVDPSEALAYYLSNVHWFDAFSPPVSRHLPRLAETIMSLLSTMAGAAVEAEEAKEVC